MQSAHLLTTSLKRLDGTGDYLLRQAEILRKAGVDVYLYAHWAHENVREKVSRYEDLPARCSAQDLIIYHYGIWDSGFEIVCETKSNKKSMYYHNQTPPFLLDHDHATRENVEKGLIQIRKAKNFFKKFFANSPFTISQEAARESLVDVDWVWLPPIIRDQLSFQECGPNENRNYVFAYVGRILPHKGLLKALRIFEAYRKKNASAKMIVIGGGAGAYMDACLELSERIGGVDYAIDVSNTERDFLLSRSIALLNLSSHEGFSIPVIEAVSAGCIPFYGNSEWLDMMIAEPSLRLALDGDYEYAAWKAANAISKRSIVMKRVKENLLHVQALMTEEYQLSQLLSV